MQLFEINIFACSVILLTNNYQLPAQLSLSSCY